MGKGCGGFQLKRPESWGDLDTIACPRRIPGELQPWGDHARTLKMFPSYHGMPVRFDGLCQVN